MSTFGAQGCTILAWAENAEGAPASPRELLSDAATLWGVRWNTDFSWHTVDGNDYIFAVLPRFTVGRETIERALGDLSLYIKFYRGGANDTWEALVKYKTCLGKWNVPDQVTAEYTSGESSKGGTLPASWGGKRARH